MTIPTQIYMWWFSYTHSYINFNASSSQSPRRLRNWWVITDSHAPIKHQQPVSFPVPFMNSNLRKACPTKSILRNRYFRGGRTKGQWESYRKSRNAATKLKAEFMNRYVENKCNPMYSTVKQNVFWDNIKPFMTEKVKHDNKSICLEIDDFII